MYNPAIGRFVERDPIGYEGTDSDLYRYAGNRPTSAADPSGLAVVFPDLDWTGTEGERLLAALGRCCPAARMLYSQAERAVAPRHINVTFPPWVPLGGGASEMSDEDQYPAYRVGGVQYPGFTAHKGDIFLNPDTPGAQQYYVLLHELANEANRAAPAQIMEQARNGLVSREQYIREMYDVERQNQLRAWGVFNECAPTWCVKKKPKEDIWPPFDSPNNPWEPVKGRYGARWDEKYRPAWDRKHAIIDVPEPPVRDPH